MTSVQKNIQLMLEFLKAPFLVLHFSYYTLMTFLMMLSILSLIRHLICASELESDLQDTMDWDKKIDFNAGKTQLVSFDWSNNTDPIDVKMDVSVLEEKLSFKMMKLTFSSKLDWGSYIISIANSVSKKIGAIICYMKFISLDVTLYLYKSIICPCMEYCCHIWTSATQYYFELLDKL